MVDMMLYQSAYHFFKAYTGTHLGVAFLVQGFAPLLFGDVLDNTQQIYVNQFQIIDIGLPFFLVRAPVSGQSPLEGN